MPLCTPLCCREKIAFSMQDKGFAGLHTKLFGLLQAGRIKEILVVKGAREGPHINFLGGQVPSGKIRSHLMRRADSMEKRPWCREKLKAKGEGGSRGGNGWMASPTQWTCCHCSYAQSSLTLCDLMDCSTPGFSVLHRLLEFAQTHVHWISDAIQPSHPLLSPSPAFNLSQHQGLF